MTIGESLQTYGSTNQFNFGEQSRKQYEPPYRNYMIQRYMDTLVNTGAYFNSGGAETFKEWVQSPMYVFVWPKDGGSISDRVTLRLQKDTSADPYGIRGATDRQGTQADQEPYQGQKTSVILMTRHRAESSQCERQSCH